jgi:ferredoxin
VIERGDFGRLFDILHARGYATVGPTVRDGAIVYDELTGVKDLPAGWTDVQEAGRYRLERRTDEALFGYVIGPHAWKKFLFSPRQKLWSATRNDHGFDVTADAEPPRKLALIGARSCELAAIAIHDKVLTGGKHADAHYRRRREDLFVVAVNCTKAGGTCFCVSMNTGPKVRDGYDLAATEVIEGKRHYFVVSAGTDAGAEVLKDVPHTIATDEEKAAAYLLEAQAVIGMGRKLDTHGLKDVLLMAQSHPHWDTVAERCLGCANCTMVCPTCFCSTIEDVIDITGRHAERWRRWDSCFNVEFSYIHGGAVRTSTAARYRQWMTHKLATWHEQFGSSGCVGCGRCITWCPVGIDITAEANALRGAVTRRGK